MGLTFIWHLIFVFLCDFSQPTSYDNTMKFFKKQFWNHYLNILKMLFLFFRHIYLFFFGIKSLLLSINTAFEVMKFYHFSLWIAFLLPDGCLRFLTYVDRLQPTHFYLLWKHSQQRKAPLLLGLPCLGLSWCSVPGKCNITTASSLVQSWDFPSRTPIGRKGKGPSIPHMDWCSPRLCRYPWISGKSVGEYSELEVSYEWDKS